MKRSNLFILSTLAVATVMGVAACGAKDSKGPVTPTTRARVDSKASGKDAQGNEIKDQNGAFGVSGEGAFAATSQGGIPELDGNIDTDDNAVKMITTMPKDVVADLEKASTLKTFINLGCKDSDGKFPAAWSDAIKGLTEAKVEPSKDVTVYSAFSIFICGKLSLPSRVKMTANNLFMKNAYPSAAELKQGKWILSANTIYSMGTENTISLPLKADGDTSLDLNVAKEIRGLQLRDGSRHTGGKLQIRIAKKPSTGQSKPKGTKRTKDTLDLDADIAPTSTPNSNSDLGLEKNVLEEGNGQSNENNI